MYTLVLELYILDVQEIGQYTKQKYQLALLCRLTYRI